MRKIAPELDQMMWFLAEQGSTEAVEQFEARYPELKYELAQRISIVRQFRGAGRRAHREVTVPAFRPVEVRPVPQSRRLVAGVAALSLAAIAAATYTAVVFMQPTPAPSVRHETAPPIQTPIEQNPEPTQESPAPTPSEPTPKQAEPEPPVDTTPAYLKPQELKVEQAPLVTALRLVAAQGGLQLTVAPNMPNPQVRFSYHGLNTIEMLQDLGRQYAFTAFDQGDGTVLIVPAVDPNAPVERDNVVKPLEKDSDKLDVRRRTTANTSHHDP
jgi:hypothetical protein